MAKRKGRARVDRKDVDRERTQGRARRAKAPKSSARGGKGVDPGAQRPPTGRGGGTRPESSRTAAEGAADTDDEIAQMRVALEESEAVDARRISIERDGDLIVLLGWVATAEEASAAAVTAEGAVEAPVRVDERLQIDPGLREGAVDARPTEPDTAADDEVLIGDPDMLAGPDARVTEDLAEAVDESEPWSPPDYAHIPDPPWPRPDLIAGEAEEAGDAGEESPAAADVSAAELAAGSLPALDPDRTAQDEGPPLETRDARPDDLPGPNVDRMPGTVGGPGAVGEWTTGGGPIGSVPATETGAKGADAAEADPARVTGGTSKGGGATRGPSSDEDPAIRGEVEEDE